MAGDPGSHQGGRALTILDGFAEPTLRLPRSEYLKIIGHCYDGLPDEACGLLAGRLQPGSLVPDGRIEVVYPTINPAKHCVDEDIGVHGGRTYACVMGEWVELPPIEITKP